MSLTLTSTITADEETVAVTGTVLASIVGNIRFALDDEILTLRGFGTMRPHPNGSVVVNRQSWICSRGQEGSTKATHTSGTELKAVANAWLAGASITPPSPIVESGGSSGVTVTGSQGGGPFVATEIKVAGVATDLGDGVIGQGLVLRRLGPYRVTYQTQFIAVGAAVGVGDLGDGDVVLRVYAIPVTSWAVANGSPVMQLSVGRPVIPESGDWWNTEMLFSSTDCDQDPPSDVVAEYPVDLDIIPTYEIVHVVADPGAIRVTVFDDFDSAAPTAGSMDVYAIIATPAA